jgi:hypothetical protein
MARLLTVKTAKAAVKTPEDGGPHRGRVEHRVADQDLPLSELLHLGV